MFTCMMLLIACHFIADFAFQSEFLGIGKGKSWELNFYHAITYTATFVVFAKVSMPFAALLFVSHIVVDPLKARYRIIKHIWQDQLIHVAVIIAGVWFAI